MLIDVLVYLGIGLALTIAFGYIIIMIMLGPIAAYEKLRLYFKCYCLFYYNWNFIFNI